jgi:hypothetical protein
VYVTEVLTCAKPRSNDYKGIEYPSIKQWVWAILIWPCVLRNCALSYRHVVKYIILFPQRKASQLSPPPPKPKVLHILHGKEFLRGAQIGDSCKQNHMGWCVCLSLMQDVSPEELVQALPAHNPRYVAYSYCFTHDDGRISYPLIFVYFSPLGM